MKSLPTNLKESILPTCKMKMPVLEGHYIQPRKTHCFCGANLRRAYLGLLACWLMLAFAPPLKAEAESPSGNNTNTVEAEAESLLGEETDAVEVISSSIAEDTLQSTLPTALLSKIRIGEVEASTVDLGTVLLQAPSVAIRRTGSPGSLMTTSIRGSSSDQVVIQLGGLPLTPPGGGLVDLSIIPPSILEDISVVRGTEATSFGAGALGGVLELAPIRPDADESRALSVRYDTLESIGTAAQLAGKEGSVTYSAALDIHKTGGRYTYERQLTPNLQDAPWNVEERENNGAFLFSGLFSTLVDASGGDLRLSAFTHRGRNEIAGMLGFPTHGAESFTSRTLIGGSFLSKVSNYRALRWSARSWISTDSYEFSPGPEPSSSAGPEFDNSRQVLGASAGVEALVANTIVELGAETSIETLSGTGIGAKRTSHSIFLSDTAYLFRDRITLHGAFRFDSIGDLPRAMASKAGAKIELPYFVSLLANIGQGIRAPTLFELHGETALVQKNEDLLSETATTLDLGIQLGAGSSTARLALWHTKYTDLISYELFPPLRLRPVNIGEAKIRGLEFETQLHPTQWFALKGAYTLTDTENLTLHPSTQGKSLPYRPRHVLFSRSELNLGFMSWISSIEAQSEYPRNRSNTKWVSSRLNVGTGLVVPIQESFYASLWISNILDNKRTQDLFAYPLPGRTFFFVLGYGNKDTG